ncbi:MAG: hypothetical protein K9H16_00315 [Bacteroidales bacterium]|nr:hypothetical protein [Bacteroidales bacterium]
MNQHLAFYSLHLKQLKRLLETLGIFRFLVVLGGGAGLLLAFFTFLSHSENMEIAAGGIFILLFFLQIQRKDKIFLKINFYQFRKILFFQYLLFSTPVLGFLIYFQKWYLLIILFTGLVILPFINFKIKIKNLNTGIQQWLPDTSFEWKAGLRINFLLIALTWIGGVVFSFMVGAVPLALLILGILPLKFYENGEPLSMLIASEKSPERLILEKFKNHVAIFSILSLPLVLMFIIFHHGLWYIVAIEFVVFLSLHLYFILLKYAFYQPGQKPGGVELFSGIGVVGVVLPIFLPIVWLLCIRFYFKSKSNLKQYLHDFD